MSPKGRLKINDKYPYAKRLVNLIGDKKNNEISQITDVSTSTVADYMSGRQRPSADFLSGLAKYGVDIRYILTGERIAPANELEESSALIERIAELEAHVSELRELLEDKRQIVKSKDTEIEVLKSQLSNQGQKLG